MNAGRTSSSLSFEGVPVIVHTLDVFEKDPKCTGVILVSSQQERKQILNELLTERSEYSKVRHIVQRGK